MACNDVISLISVVESIMSNCPFDFFILSQKNFQCDCDEVGGTLGTIYLRNYRRRYYCSVSFSTTVYTYYVDSIVKKKKMCLKEAFQLSSFPGPGTFVCVAVLLLLADAMVMLRRLMTSRSVAPSDAKNQVNPTMANNRRLHV